MEASHNAVSQKMETAPATLYNFIQRGQNNVRAGYAQAPFPILLNQQSGFRHGA